MMPPKKWKKKQISFPSISLSAGKGVGYDLDEELLAVSTLKTSKVILALALTEKVQNGDFVYRQDALASIFHREM